MVEKKRAPVRLLLIGNFLSSFSKAKAPVEDLCDSFKKRGWRVCWASEYKNRLCRLADMVISVVGLKGRYEIAVVMVYSGPSFYWAEICAWLLKLKRRSFALALHGGNLPDFSRKYPNRIKRLFAAASAIVAPSKYLSENLESSFKVQIIPNGIHVDRFEFSLRQNLRPEIVWIRAFHSIYRPQMVPGIVAQAAAEFPNVHVTMIGQDKKDGSLEMTRQAIQELKVERLVTIIEGVSNQEIPDYLKRADVFLNTSSIDNMPVSIMEAMACGLCIVSTRVGGVPYLVRDEVEGLLVKEDDEAALSAAVCRLLRDNKLASKLSSQARITAEKFDWDNITREWESLFKMMSDGEKNASRNS